MLITAEKYRYARQINLQSVGVSGQEKLKLAKVLVIGCGGLGCPVLSYLTGAGIGTLGIADHDTVDESNLHRQILFDAGQLGLKKVDCVKEKLNRQNPYVKIVSYPFSVTSENAAEIIKQYDLVIDGSDNIETRYLVNDICVQENIPFVYGAIYKFEGQVSVFNYKNGPTYRCVFPEPPLTAPDCHEAGVLPVLPGVIGTLMANEALKIVLELGEILSGKLMLYNALNMSFSFINFERKANDPEFFIQPDSAKLSCEENRDVFFQINSDLFFEKMKTKTVFLDVRELWEEPQIECENLLRIPLDQIEIRINEIPRNQELVVFCQSGGRSLQAIQLLNKMFGYTNMYNLEKGLNACQIES